MIIIENLNNNIYSNNIYIINVRMGRVMQTFI